jgi:Cft2 family RNA processing exonuclease
MKKSQRRTASSSFPLSCFSYGVGHDNEGICLLLQIGDYRILLDCGLDNLDELLDRVRSSAIDLVFCSHAHEDHCRGLQELHRAFPELPIYTSEVTARLLPLHWSQEELNWCRTLPWRSPIAITKDLQIELFPAGHLPGAAAISIAHETPERTYKVMYTGDFSVSNFQLVEGLSIEDMRGLAPDVLIVEGSYGTVRHPHRRQQEKQLMQKIDRALESGQNVLLPVPPIGLGQEILKLLRSHHQFTGRELDLWVDSTLAAACDVYLELLPQFPPSVQNFAKHQSLFWDERVCPRMRRLESNTEFIQNNGAYIILADYRTDLLSYLQSQTRQWLILLPEHPQEYLTPDSPAISLLLDNLDRVTIDSYLLAEHCDGRNTTQLIHNLRPQHIIFVHGLLNYLVELASLEELRNRYQVHSPVNGILVELPLGDRFVHPLTPQPIYYEGELNESGTAIAITLPDTIEQDPRWSKIADTGIIEARWQGEELIIRGVSQRELLKSRKDVKISDDLDCCNRCLYYNSQRCWNQASPLYGFKVIPEGYCPVFEAVENDKI